MLGCWAALALGVERSQGGSSVWSLWVVASWGSSWGAGRPPALVPVDGGLGRGRVAPRPAVSAMSPVNRIKDQCKVSVRIPPDSEKSSLIRIEGDPQGVRQAKRELLELASRMVSPAGLRCAPVAGPWPSLMQCPTAGVCWHPSGSHVLLLLRLTACVVCTAGRGERLSPPPDQAVASTREQTGVSCSTCLIRNPGVVDGLLGWWRVPMSQLCSLLCAVFPLTGEPAPRGGYGPRGLQPLPCLSMHGNI